MWAGFRWLLLLACVGGAGSVRLAGQGFPNVPQTPGRLLTPLLAPQQGRTAVIAYHNGWLYTVPEIPSSEPGSDYLVRRWDLSDLGEVRVAEVYEETEHPVMAHGYVQVGDYLCLGDNWPEERPFSFRAVAPGVNERAALPGLQGPYDRGDLFQPWHVNTYWSYNPGEMDAPAVLRKRGEVLATWDHIGQTGVIGHPFLIGNLLIFASDQSRTGVAVYDVGDPSRPRLLDVLKTGGPGGYWPELWGGGGRLLLVFPYQQPSTGMRVVDLSDPENLRLVADVALPGAETMYAQFQDEHAFLGSHKVDMRTFSSVLRLDTEGTGVDTSQFLLPLGNLLATGGIGPGQGLAVWAHQAEPDTRGPSVGYHIPRAGQTNYPRGAPISLLIHETLGSTTITVGENLVVRPLGGSPVPGTAVFSFDDILTFTPDADLLPDTTYEVVLAGGGIRDAAGNGIEEYRFSFSTGALVSGNRPPAIGSFAASRHPVPPGESVAFSVSATDPEEDALAYRFDFGDGSEPTAWTTEPGASHRYAVGGRFLAKAFARDPDGQVAVSVRTVTVTAETPGGTPPRSSEVAVDEAGRTVWAVNPDHASVSALDADTLAKRFEAAVGAEPRSVAVDRQGRAWVACRGSDRIDRIRPDGAALAPVALDYGDAPHGIVVSPDGTSAYVSLAGAGEVARLDVATGTVAARLALGPTPRALALSPDGGTLYVARFLSAEDHAEIWRIDTATMSLAATIRLDKLGGDAHRDGSAEGKGTPNLLAGLAASKDGSRLLVASAKANSDRGTLVGNDLDQDNTVRSLLTVLDAATGEVLDSIDLDNSDAAGAVAFSPLDDYFFAILPGNDDLVVFDRYEVDRSAGMGGFVTRQRVGQAPRGLACDPRTGRLFVKNDLGRDLTVLELAEFYAAGQADFPRRAVATAASEPLSEEVLRGKRLFHHAGDPRMSAEGYLSCATCHPDGGHDGRTWDFTGRGEGLRNTSSLLGRAGLRHGKLHWTANFDEVQDFEQDIRAHFGGSGFLTDEQFAGVAAPLGPPKAGLDPDLDALAAYVSSLGRGHLRRSPHRAPDGSLTAEGARGQEIFVREGCAVCHAGPEMTDGLLHDVGTAGTTSGKRLGGPLPGIETPTLRGIWESAPYLHDGSAAALGEVFSATGGTRVPAESGAISGGGEVVDEWTYYNHDETVRGEAFAHIWEGGTLALAGIDGGAGGTGAVSVRYSLGYSSGTLRVRVNGTDYEAPIQPTGNVPHWRYVNWRRARVEGVELRPGPDNLVELTATEPSWLPVGIDEIAVSTAAELAAAEPHRRIGVLPGAERAALEAFLRQLDGSPLPGEAGFPPESPRNLSLAAGSGGGVLLRWDDAPGTAGYRIYRSSSGDFAEASEIAETGERFFLDESPPEGATLHYWVAGRNESGESVPSAVRFDRAQPAEPGISGPQPDLLVGTNLRRLLGGGIQEGVQIHRERIRAGRPARAWFVLATTGTAGPVRLRSASSGSGYRWSIQHGRFGNLTGRLLADRFEFDTPLRGGDGRLELRLRHRGPQPRLVVDEGEVGRPPGPAGLRKDPPDGPVSPPVPLPSPRREKTAKRRVAAKAWS